MKKANPIEVVKDVAEGLGWQTFEGEEELFLGEISFLVPLKYTSCAAHFFKRNKDQLQFEMMIEIYNFPQWKFVEYLKLLNYINQNISIGLLCTVYHEEEERTFLVFRASLLFSPSDGLSEEIISSFAKHCAENFELLLPYICDFLAEKPTVRIYEDGRQELLIKTTAESIMNFINSGETAGCA